MSSDYVLTMDSYMYLVTLRFDRAGGNPFAARVQLVEERGTCNNCCTNFYVSCSYYSINPGLCFIRKAHD